MMWNIVLNIILGAVKKGPISRTHMSSFIGNMEYCLIEWKIANRHPNLSQWRNDIDNSTIKDMYDINSVSDQSTGKLSLYYQN